MRKRRKKNATVLHSTEYLKCAFKPPSTSFVIRLRKDFHVIDRKTLIA